MASRSTKRIVVRTAVVAGAIAAVTGVTAASTLAATTYTVKAGTKASGTAAYTGKTTTGGITFTDGALQLGCDGGTANGVASLGTARGAKIATITGTTWKNCTGPFGIVLVPQQVGTWSVVASGPTNSAGITKGYVGNVVANVTNPDGLCSFTVTGSAVGKYNNSTGKLELVNTTTGTRVLKTSNVQGCTGLINTGDTVGFAASYTITAGTLGKLSIKSNP